MSVTTVDAIRLPLPSVLVGQHHGHHPRRHGRLCLIAHGPTLNAIVSRKIAYGNIKGSITAERLPKL